MKHNKSKDFHLRLNEMDSNLLQKESEVLNLSKSEVLRLYIRSQKAQKILHSLNKNKAMQSRILLEISRVAGNINQIAYHLNSEKLEENEALNLFKEQAENTKVIFKYFQQIAKKEVEKMKTILKE